MEETIFPLNIMTTAIEMFSPQRKRPRYLRFHTPTFHGNSRDAIQKT
jgi:hypothetical protein